MIKNKPVSKGARKWIKVGVTSATLGTIIGGCLLSRYNNDSQPRVT